MTGKNTVTFDDMNFPSVKYTRGLGLKRPIGLGMADFVNNTYIFWVHMKT